jgi:hypothetical protein
MRRRQRDWRRVEECQLVDFSWSSYVLSSIFPVLEVLGWRVGELRMGAIDDCNRRVTGLVFLCRALLARIFGWVRERSRERSTWCLEIVFLRKLFFPIWLCANVVFQFKETIGPL